jgi:hypothetical protein
MTSMVVMLSNCFDTIIVHSLYKLSGEFEEGKVVFVADISFSSLWGRGRERVYRAACICTIICLGYRERRKQQICESHGCWLPRLLWLDTNVSTASK